MAEFDINKVKGNDRFIAGGAVVLFVLTFFPWYSISGAGRSFSFNMWHAYGWNKLAFLLALAAGAVVIARLMGALEGVKLPAGINLITLGLSGLATVIFVLRFVFSFHQEGAFGLSVSGHPAFGWYIGLIVSAAMTYFAFLNFTASGEVLPSKPGVAPPTSP